MKKDKATDSLVKKHLEAQRVEENGKPHQFRHKKSLPLPKSPRSEKRLSKVSLTPKEKTKISFVQNHCTPNPRYPMLYLEALKNRKIANDGVRELLIAKRNLQQSTFEMQKWIHSQINRKISLLNEEAEPYYNLVEKREERHFQMDRIIKYLSSF